MLRLRLSDPGNGCTKLKFIHLVYDLKPNKVTTHTYKLKGRIAANNYELNLGKKLAPTRMAQLRRELPNCLAVSKLIGFLTSTWAGRLADSRSVIRTWLCSE